MAIRIEHQVTIDRPTTEVSEYVARLENEAEYWDGVKSVKLTSGTSGTVGATYQRVFEAMGKQREAALTLAEVTPGQKVRVQAAGGPVKVTGTMTFTPAGDGTNLHFNMEAQTSWFLGLVKGKIAKNMETASKASLEKLKTVLESRPRPTPPEAPKPTVAATKSSSAKKK